MIDFLWVFRSKRCAVCGETGTTIELTIRYAGRKVDNRWFCTFRHLDEWREKVREGKMEMTKVITEKK